MTGVQTCALPICPVTSIVGLVLGITSLRHVPPRGPKGGRGMAITGIVLSGVFIALMAFVIVALILTGTSTNYD